jgi:TRAP-type mannitol/chloroaromatic compound transport system substrate-binding protein
MLKKLLLSTVIVAASTFAASAMEAPTSAETCHKMLDDVTQTADASKLPEEVLGKLDELMNTAEKQCESGQFKEVVQTAEAIQKELTAKN